MISCLNAFVADMIQVGFESIINNFYLSITSGIIIILLITSYFVFVLKAVLDLVKDLILSLMATYFIPLDDSTHNKIAQYLLISINQLKHSLDYESTEIYSHLCYLDLDSK
jgi:mannitol-specific phosphotransferase system IIBC component